MCRTYICIQYIIYGNRQNVIKNAKNEFSVTSPLFHWETYLLVQLQMQAEQCFSLKR